MSKLRELVTTVNVGEYKFDIKVNRQIVYDAFKQHEGLWNTIAKLSDSDASKGKIGRLDDMMDILSTNDTIEEERPKFVEDILPRMIAEAASNVESDEFLKYCDENGVREQVDDYIFNFAMLGFTGGKGVQDKQAKPKIKVQFTMK